MYTYDPPCPPHLDSSIARYLIRRLFADHSEHIGGIQVSAFSNTVRLENLRWRLEGLSVVARCNPKIIAVAATVIRCYISILTKERTIAETNMHGHFKIAHLCLEAHEPIVRFYASQSPSANSKLISSHYSAPVIRHIATTNDKDNIDGNGHCQNNGLSALNALYSSKFISKCEPVIKVSSDHSKPKKRLEGARRLEHLNNGFEIPSKDKFYGHDPHNCNVDLTQSQVNKPITVQPCEASLKSPYLPSRNLNETQHKNNTTEQILPHWYQHFTSKKTIENNGTNLLPRILHKQELAYKPVPLQNHAAPYQQLTAAAMTMYRGTITQNTANSRTREPAKPAVEKPAHTVTRRTGKIPISERICSNCHTRETPSWRFGMDGILLCNACALYSTVRGVKRPSAFFSTPVRKRQRQPRVNMPQLNANNDNQMTHLKNQLVYPNLEGYVLPQPSTTIHTPLNIVLTRPPKMAEVKDFRPPEAETSRPCTSNDYPLESNGLEAQKSP